MLVLKVSESFSSKLGIMSCPIYVTTSLTSFTFLKVLKEVIHVYTRMDDSTTLGDNIISTSCLYGGT
ncbi:unnamed protein product [Rhizophagus irregularis]|nr:unnamed protein product [Rhizophagus irregularis]